jgi:hypothetical protein
LKNSFPFFGIDRIFATLDFRSAARSMVLKTLITVKRLIASQRVVVSLSWGTLVFRLITKMKVKKLSK